jgi:hypothetical protein
LAALKDWEVVSLMDQNGDGKADVWFRHQSSDPAKNLMVWTMNGTTRLSKIDEIRDFLNPKADIVWQDSTGQIVLWDIGGPQFKTSILASFPMVIGLWRWMHWQILMGMVR